MRVNDKIVKDIIEAIRQYTIEFGVKPDKIITNIQMGSALHDTLEFMSNHSGIIDMDSGPVGTIDSVDAYIDPNMRWDENKATLYPLVNGHEIRVEYNFNDSLI